jgi:PAS domain S-box-containing protein
LTEASQDAIIVADQKGQITLFNPAAERIFGYAAGEVLGQPLALVIPPEFQERHQHGLERFVQTRQSRILGRLVEMRGRRKDGTEFPLELSLSAIDLGGEIQFLGAIRDTTERNRMRTVLVQSEKLASIGLLSAGVAHEINNPLAYVANNLAVLERDTRGLLALLNLYEGARDRLAQVDPETTARARALAEEIDPSEPATRIASRAPVWVAPTTTVVHAAATMIQLGMRHMLVLAPSGEAVGVLSMRDVFEILLRSVDGGWLVDFAAALGG